MTIYVTYNIQVILTHSPLGNFAKKPVLKLVERFSDHYGAIKRGTTYHKAVYRSYIWWP